MAPRTIRMAVNPERLRRAVRAGKMATQAQGADALRRFDLEVAALVDPDRVFQSKVDACERRARALRIGRSHELEELLEASMPCDDDGVPVQRPAPGIL